jgi:hypothetical protein
MMSRHGRACPGHPRPCGLSDNNATGTKMYEARHLLYLNLADDDVWSFLPAWAAYRGMLSTPRYFFSDEERRTRLALTPHLVGLFRKHNLIALEKEFALEAVRMTRHPQCGSRVPCIYAWPDETIAHVAPAIGRHRDAILQKSFWLK